MLKRIFLALAAVSILILPIIQSEAGVIGMWLFDEDGGNVAEDLSPTGNNGVVADGVKWVEGKFGSAVEVSGPGADVVIPMLDVYNQEELTFECWVYPFNVTPQQYNQIIITGRDAASAQASGGHKGTPEDGLVAGERRSERNAAFVD
ncbi:MAG: hypothetical protein ACE5OR_15620, partial [bacterium]